MAIKDENIVQLSAVVTDVRSPLKQVLDFLFEWPMPGFSYLAIGVGITLAPKAFLLFILIGVWFLFVPNKPNTLPIHIPFVEEKLKDTNDPNPNGGFNKPQGIFMLGYVLGSMQHIYLKFEAALRHFLILGTTGAGKSETMLSLVANYLAFGAGVIYNDAKATVKLFVQLFTLARYFGRDDDVRLVNYIKAADNIKRDPADRLTNTSAPFSFGSADNGIQLTASLMPEDSGGSNKVFQESAVALISAVFPALTELRDSGVIKLSPRIIRKYTNYSEYCDLMKHPLISRETRENLIEFVKTRSGYNPKLPTDKQPEEVTKQFGFAQAYFARCLQSLSNTYGDIYMHGTGEVDFRDLVLQDRIMLTMLPSMQKSGAELGNLSKIILTSVKNSLSVGLGLEVQGSVEDVVDGLPMSTNRPSLVINDEYPYMAVKGYAVTAAQARGLNISMVFGAQDFAGIKRADPDEAEQIWANSRVKYIMASEGDQETWSRVKELAQDVWTHVRTGMSSQNADTRYYSNPNVDLRKIERLSLNDLRKLNEGEGALFFQDKMFLIKNFWHGLTRKDLAKNIRIFTMARCDHRPTRGEYALLMTDGNLSALHNTRIWFDHLDADDFKADNIRISPRLKASLMAGTANDDSISANQRAYRMLKAYSNGGTFETVQVENTAFNPTTPSILSNRGGTFSNSLDAINQSDDEDEDTIQANKLIDDMFNAVKEHDGLSENKLSSLLASFNSDTEQQTPLADIQSVQQKVDYTHEIPPYEEAPDEDSVGDETLETSLFPRTNRRRIAEGIAKIEQQLGNNNADAVSKQVLSNILDSTTYPKEKLVASQERLNEFRNILDQFTRDIDK